MKLIKNVLWLTLCFLSVVAGAAEGDRPSEDAYVRQKVIILGSFKDYAAALKSAKEVSAQSGVPFATRGMVYDKKEGLIWPKGSDNEVNAGNYTVRRYNNECDEGQSTCITVERSRYYEGMEPGYYILVGGIYAAESREADKPLKTFQKVVPSAYAKVSKVYMGCLD